VADAARPDVFVRARRRLALLFAALVVVLVVVSSVFMYLTVRADIRAAASGAYQDSESEQAFVSRSLGSLRWQLVAVDAVIVIVVGAGGLLYARSTLRPIRESVAAQKRFVADASHDLRTPLAIMKAEFEVALRRPELDETTRPVLLSGLEEVDRMSGMVEDLLTLSRIDAHQEPLARERLDLVALARQTVDELSALAASAGVALRAEAVGAAFAVGDERHVRRALRNVVRNGVEHSPPGAQVEVAVQPAAAGPQVVVTDHGEGMPPEVLDHVFDRFYRGDAARSHARGGSGLGLAIAYWALRGMGGDVSVVSEVSTGTRVTLTLPPA
jgi:signal transduction histidine kinase